LVLPLSISGVKEVLKITAAKKPAASEPERQEEKAPGFRKLCDHITATWTEKKKGLKPAWSKDAWVQLARQTTRFQCHEIAGLWDEYLRSVDSFVVNVQAYSLVWFATRTIDALVDVTDYKKMGRAYEDFWNGKGHGPANKGASTFREAIASKTPARAQKPTPKMTEPEPEDTPETDSRSTPHDGEGPRARAPARSKPCAFCDTSRRAGKAAGRGRFAGEAAEPVLKLAAAAGRPASSRQHRRHRRGRAAKMRRMGGPKKDPPKNASQGPSWPKRAKRIKIP
jgi:hypothetical protein